MRRITKAFRTRASGAHPLRSYEAQEVEGLCAGLDIEEVPDRRERTDMCHVQPGHGRDLVVGNVELQDVPGLI